MNIHIEGEPGLTFSPKIKGHLYPGLYALITTRM